jgi:peptide/nickel transport system substrate-binding protein
VRSRRLGVLATAAIAVLAAACANPPAARSSAGHVLIEEATTGVTFAQDFNPFDSNSMASGMNMRSLVYEPLVEFDALDPTAAGSHYWLATGYSFSNGGQTLAVKIRSGVKFNDGSSFGPNDVAATFKAIKDNGKLNTSGVGEQSADPTVSGDTVTLSFSSPQYTNLWAILGSTYIVSAAVAGQLAGNPTMTIANPVGTGPFMLKSYSSSLVKFKPNPNYWGGAPPESEVDIPSISDNNAASAALSSNQLDWAGNDVPNVYANYVNLDPVHNHAWFAPGNTVTLWFNVTSATAPALQDAAVRRAISYGIDRTALSELGESGYEQPATSSGGLILPNQQSYLPTDGTLTNDLPSKPEPDSTTASSDKWNGPTVESILSADGWTAPAGYPKAGNCDGSSTAKCWTKGGQIIKFSIYDPVPFTDYWENATLISQELQSIGMDVTTKPAQGYSDWNTNLLSGNFESAIHWGNGGNIPYVQYENWLDSANKSAGADFGNFTSSDAAQALSTYAGTDPSNTQAVDAAVQTLEKIVSTEAPVVPLLYGADWNVFSTTKYLGWPDQKHPYMNPSPDDPELPYILMHLRPV